MKKILFVILITIFSIPVQAGDGSGNVVRIYAHDKNGGEGVIMFEIENHTNPPICSGREWAFDANNSLGKAM